MRFLKNEEENDALKFLEMAAKVAEMATCERSKCGCVIVNKGELIGYGFNSPTGNIEGQRKCGKDKSGYNKKVTDKTCCVHAEQRAIMNALSRNSSLLEGSRLYFIRMKEGKASKAGKPYCTMCSKMALDVGVSEFVLWHDEGICVYNTEEYNSMSYDYDKI
ncbi:MAG: hypothetical protein Q8Q35_02610 [Nanoarchaeota archaeon]|nr:hypothetical protein [Nanoarchaeota archaeon]